MNGNDVKEVEFFKSNDFGRSDLVSKVKHTEERMVGKIFNMKCLKKAHYELGGKEPKKCVVER